MTRQVCCLVASLLVSGSVACDFPPDGLASLPDSPEPPVVEPMYGFSWVAESLAAMPRPGIGRPLEEDLEFLAGERLDLLVSLTEDPIDPAQLEAFGIEALHVPVRDFTAPTMAQLEAFMAEILPRMEAGERVGVHCTAGKGRTGTMMAAYFVTQGLRASEALAEIRRLRPGSVETTAQEQRIGQFEAVWSGRVVSGSGSGIEPPSAD